MDKNSNFPISYIQWCKIVNFNISNNYTIWSIPIYQRSMPTDSKDIGTENKTLRKVISSFDD